MIREIVVGVVVAVVVGGVTYLVMRNPDGSQTVVPKDPAVVPNTNISVNNAPEAKQLPPTPDPAPAPDPLMATVANNMAALAQQMQAQQAALSAMAAAINGLSSKFPAPAPGTPAPAPGTPVTTA